MTSKQTVNQQEYKVPQGVNLISKTDTFGTIIDCNDAFELASGFTREQLIGSAHNIVRHADVPKAIFKDMWQTLQSGQPWSQVVKNRRADGGYYWVRANATPLFKNGEISGFMSVRTAVTDEEITTTEQAYRSIESQQVQISHGEIHSGIHWQNINPMNRMEPKYKITLLVALFYLFPYLIIAYYHQHSLSEILSASVFALSTAWLFGHYQTKRILQRCQNLKKIASNEPIKFDWAHPESLEGQVQGAMKSAQLILDARQEESEYRLDQANQAQSALDQVSSNIMIANEKLEITYLNQQMQNFLHERIEHIKHELPEFKFDSLIGTNIDIFHQHPKQTRARIEKMTEPTHAEIQLGSLSLSINIIPIKNRNNQVQNLVVEWQDLTAERQLLENVNHTVTLAREGLLENRIDLSKTSGIAMQLGHTINDLLDNIERPINETIDIAVSLSAGKLDDKIQSNFMGRFLLLKDSLNVAVENLSSMLSQTKLSSDEIAKGAQTIYETNQDLVKTSQQQSNALNSASENMRSMTQEIEQNANKASQAADLTTNTANIAKSGMNIMQNAISSMEQIHDSSQKIHDIIGLIDSIAFQTNLLALNASVEAARAGEQGKGFAVVASEVRSLAQKSAEASQQIRVLIEDTVQKIGEGTQNVKGSGDALNEIAESVEQVKVTIEELSHFSFEQSQQIHSMTQVIQGIDREVHNTTLRLDNSTKLASSLNNMSVQMSNTVNQFKIAPEILKATHLPVSNQVDFAAARRAHRQWRVNVRAYINDIPVNFDKNSADNGQVCALGKWIYGIGREFEHLPAYQKLEVEHAKMHQFIGQVIQLKDQGKIAEANREMLNLEKMSAQVVGLIDNLEHALISHQETELRPIKDDFEEKPEQTKATINQVIAIDSKQSNTSHDEAHLLLGCDCDYHK